MPKKILERFGLIKSARISDASETTHGDDRRGAEISGGRQSLVLEGVNSKSARDLAAKKVNAGVKVSIVVHQAYSARRKDQYRRLFGERGTSLKFSPIAEEECLEEDAAEKDVEISSVVGSIPWADVSTSSVTACSKKRNHWQHSCEFTRVIS